MKNLYIFTAHLDDIEISTYGYIFKHYKEYDNIRFVIATTWEPKTLPWKQNLAELEKILSVNINYKNLMLPQRTLNKNLDDCKDMFYSYLDYSTPFDILTHDGNDAHTDHVAVHNISRGMYKLCDRFLTIYSPSSINYSCNYYIHLSDDTLELKQRAIDRYDHSKEQTYTKNDYYFSDDWVHNSVPTARVVENYSNWLTNKSHECEIYNILKWV